MSGYGLPPTSTRYAPTSLSTPTSAPLSPRFADSHSHHHQDSNPQDSADAARPSPTHSHVPSIYYPAHSHAGSQSSIASPDHSHSIVLDRAPFRNNDIAHVSTSQIAPSITFLPASLAGALIPLPFLVVGACNKHLVAQHLLYFSWQDACLQTGLLTSGSLFVLGVLARLRESGKALDRSKKFESAFRHDNQPTFAGICDKNVLLCVARIALLYHTTAVLGGPCGALFVLLAAGSGLARTGLHVASFNRLAQAPVTGLALFLIIFAFWAGLLPAQTQYWASGCLSAVVSLLLTRLPLSFSAHDGLAGLVDSAGALKASALIAALTVFASFFVSATRVISISSMAMSIIPMVVGAYTLSSVRAPDSSSSARSLLRSGCLVTSAAALFFEPTWRISTIVTLLAIAVYNAAILDISRYMRVHEPQPDRSANQHHHHSRATSAVNVSILTSFLLSTSRPGSIMHGILNEKDSRRIAYFTCLNFAFMIVQAFYGWASGSLGLLSDTVHMFFDCLALTVGLGASVASKWPVSPEKPYGWAKLNTLAGFGNGIFLMLVSVEFVWEAIEGIMEGKELRRVQELLVVSTLGLIVNMVGLLAFGHAHAGHDHGHSHGPAPGSQSHGHTQNKGSIYAPANAASSTAHDHAHHGHENENMHGIYLHIAADAGGSLAVILSTTLTLWKPWFLWDPLATILIAALIFAAAVPLVSSSARKLLLVIPDELEYGIKDALQELTSVKGVTGYAVPRFWVEDCSDDDGHGHSHGNDDHAHVHSHVHGQELRHIHGKEHEHGHEHSHNDDSHDGGHSCGHDHKRHGHDLAHDHDPQLVPYEHEEDACAKGAKVLGVVHVFVSRMANVEDVREKATRYFARRNMDVVVQIEPEGEGRCWCGGGVKC